MSLELIKLTVAVLIAVLSSGGLQWILNRRARQRLEEREERQDTRDERLDAKRETELLAKAQLTAQRTALDSWENSNKTLKSDYEICRLGLMNLSEATNLLIDVVETILLRVHPQGMNGKFTAELDLADITNIRQSIGDTRRHLR